METTTKQWYIVYTKEGAEHKVCEALRRRKLDSFYPANKITKVSYGREKVYESPLLKRYVFVCLSNEEINIIKGFTGIISLMYWLARPVTVTTDDIYLLKRFFNMHEDIRVEKIKVNPSEPATVSGFLPDNPVSDISLTFPILGYVMMARQREARVKVITVSGYQQTKTKLHSKYAEAR